MISSAADSDICGSNFFSLFYPFVQTLNTLAFLIISFVMSPLSYSSSLIVRVALFCSYISGFYSDLSLLFLRNMK